MTIAYPTSTYFQYLNDGKFMIQRSPSTDEWVFYPRVIAPRTGATDLEWVEPSGLGTVYAATVKRMKAQAENVSIVIVELDEGPRLMTHIVSVSAEDVFIGMRVRAKVTDGPDGKIVVFEPDSAE